MGYSLKKERTLEGHFESFRALRGGLASAKARHKAALEKFRAASLELNSAAADEKAMERRVADALEAMVDYIKNADEKAMIAQLMGDE